MFPVWKGHLTYQNLKLSYSLLNILLSLLIAVVIQTLSLSRICVCTAKSWSHTRLSCHFQSKATIDRHWLSLYCGDYTYFVNYCGKHFIWTTTNYYLSLIINHTRGFSTTYIILNKFACGYEFIIRTPVMANDFLLWCWHICPSYQIQVKE